MRLLSLLGFSGLAIALPLAAYGQFMRPPAVPDSDPNPLCYWIDAQGIRHSLTYLCGTGPAIAAPTTAPAGEFDNFSDGFEDSASPRAASGDAIEMVDCAIADQDLSNNGDHEVRIVGDLFNGSDGTISNVVVRHQLFRAQTPEGGGREFKETLDRGGSASIRGTIPASGSQEFTSNPKRISMNGFSRLFAEVQEVTWIGADGQPGRRVYSPPQACYSPRWR